jgi:hypothetical protein
VDGRQWHSETCRSGRKRCQQRLAELTADPAEIASAEPFQTYIEDRWLPQYARTYRASSARARRSQMRRWWLPALGDVSLGKLTAVHVERALASFQEQGASAKRCASLLAGMSAALGQAVR